MALLTEKGFTSDPEVTTQIHTTRSGVSIRRTTITFERENENNRTKFKIFIDQASVPPSQTQNRLGTEEAREITQTRYKLWESNVPEVAEYVERDDLDEEGDAEAEQDYYMEAEEAQMDAEMEEEDDASYQTLEEIMEMLRAEEA